LVGLQAPDCRHLALWLASPGCQHARLQTHGAGAALGTSLSLGSCVLGPASGFICIININIFLINQSIHLKNIIICVINIIIFIIIQSINIKNIIICAINIIIFIMILLGAPDAEPIGLGSCV